MPSIPKTAAPFFQEYNFSTLDVRTHATLIIERILVYGKRSEIRWLFDEYGIETVRSWVEQDGERLLPRRRLELWRTLLDIPSHLIAERRQIWPY